MQAQQDRKVAQDIRQERVNAAVSSPVLLPAQSSTEFHFRNSESRGHLFAEEQLRYLRPTAAKLWLSLLDRHSPEFMTDYQNLGDPIRVGRTTAWRALRELKNNRLVQVMELRDRRGWVVGIRVKVLLPPGYFPAEAREARRQELLERRAKIDGELALLELATHRSEEVAQ